MKITLGLLAIFSVLLFGNKELNAQSTITTDAESDLIPEPLPTSQPAIAPAPAKIAPLTQATIKEEKPPRLLSSGTSAYFQPTINLQGWFVFDHADKNATTFRVRRAELGVKGEMIPQTLSYNVVFDPARLLDQKDSQITVEDSTDTAIGTATIKQPASSSAMSILQDAFITWTTPYADITWGQFKIPVSWEGYNSATKLLFADRSPLAKAYGDKRDIGVRVAKTFKYFMYWAAAYNGAGQNTLDANNAKDVSLRLEAYPIKGLMLGGLTYNTVGERDLATMRDRFEGDLRFERGPFLLQSEFIYARDRNSSLDIVSARGFYAALAFTFFGKLQPAIRVGQIDPNVDLNLDPADAQNNKDALDEYWNYGAVLNYYFIGQEAKIQLDYQRLQYETKKATNQVILATQISY